MRMIQGVEKRFETLSLGLLAPNAESAFQGRCGGRTQQPFRLEYLIVRPVLLIKPVLFCCSLNGRDLCQPLTIRIWVTDAECAGGIRCFARKGNEVDCRSQNLKLEPL